MAWFHNWASLHVLFAMHMHAAMCAYLYAECSSERWMLFLDLCRERAALYTILLSLNDWYTILWRSFKPTVVEWYFLWSRRSTTKPPGLDLKKLKIKFVFVLHFRSPSRVRQFSSFWRLPSWESHSTTWGNRISTLYHQESWKQICK